MMQGIHQFRDPIAPLFNVSTVFLRFYYVLPGFYCLVVHANDIPGFCPENPELPGNGARFEITVPMGMHRFGKGSE
jgi:hypothetical protein